jgi:arylsulfatase A-like enzyme
MKKKLIIIFIILFIFGLFGAWKFWKNKSEKKESPQSENQNSKTDNSQTPGEKKYKRVILVTLDTLRVDHLGYMGYPRDTSPFLDSIASQSVLFKNSFSSAPMTGPSHASIFTSLYPIQHGIKDNKTVLNPKLTTMAQYFKKSGYATAGFVSAGYFTMTQLNRGFDYFDVKKVDKGNPSEEFDALSVPNLLDCPDANSNKTAVGGFGKRSGEETINKSIDWLNSNFNNQNLFLWVHLYDPHEPYRKVAEYKPSAKDKITNQKEMLNYWTNQQGLQPGSFDYLKKDGKSVTTIMNKYDGEVQYMDEQLKRLFDFAEEKGINDGALWIITNDHGQGLGSHGYISHHKQVYNEQLSAPIIFYDPNKKEGKVVDDVMETVDILPTLAELIDFKIDDSLPQDRGKSLLNYFNSNEEKSDSEAFSMRFPGPKGTLPKCPGSDQVIKLPNSKDLDRSPYEPPKQFTLQNKDYKFIYNTAETLQTKNELYDLRVDPKERNNLVDTQPEIAKIWLDKILAKIQSVGGKVFEKPAEKPSKVEMDQLERTLKSLGY